MNIESLIIKDDKMIKQALEALNYNAQGILFVVNSEQKLVGVVTDGDIRRGLIKGASLQDRIDTVMNSKFFSLPIETDNSIILDHINNRIRIIPLVDDQNRVVDYASISKIRKIPVASPLLTGNELAYVTDCVRTGWVSSQGKYVRKFEEQFKEYLNVPYALAVSNGTVALHLSLVALGIRTGHEIILPDFTFAASINAVIYTGATPVLADVDPNTWTISIESIKSLITSKTKAIMPVHIYGHPCRMDEIMELANENDLLIIEDCAQALGTKYKGRPVGGFGDAATFSFFGNKIITTGEGGMVIFKNKEAFERAEMLRDHGMAKEKRYWHLEVGFNYRMTNLQAALGVAQMERLEEFVETKRKIAETYSNTLKVLPGINLPEEKEWAMNTYWLYTFLLGQDCPVRRDELIHELLKNGIETRPVFYPLHIMPPYQKYYMNQDLSITTSIADKGISLPSSVGLKQADLIAVIEAIKNIFENKEKLQDR